MRRIIIDCDPGHDDAIAICLALAHKKQLKIEAVTTVAGNQTVEKITNNALKILDFLGEDIDVARGVSEPLVRELEIAMDNAHGDSGMDGPILPNSMKKVLKTNAIEHMAKIIRNSNEKITLVAIGPLTNIALLIKTFPDVKDKIEEISLMGGGIFNGNATSAAEFNIYVDPEAAKIVYESGIPIIMSGLDVTNKAYILKEEYQQIRNNGKVSNFVAELLDFYSKYGELHGYTGNAMHDACAVAYLLQPELFAYKDYHVDIITGDGARGKTLADTRPRPLKEPNAKVLLDINREKFVKLLFEAFEKLDEIV
ncbi:nucleoside hydrolase [Vallitalea maricola]|uniref:Nucleoside hydrolase n=1 Tax=Vallitalea maricola TaxID=3074433 RepID=A0ACB5UIA2_9FIRM|nr:nucleoside hydrolase [Vallitalea sp. AN17-2]